MIGIPAFLFGATVLLALMTEDIRVALLAAIFGLVTFLVAVDCTPMSC